MVAYSFQRRFVEPIERRTKAQTIRAVGRKRHAQAGDTLQLYFGQRTAHCRLIGTAVCWARLPIYIAARNGYVNVGGQRPPNLDVFAREDGFENWNEMGHFWRQTHGDGDFEGVVIVWRGFTLARQVRSL